MADGQCQEWHGEMVAERLVSMWQGPDCSLAASHYSLLDPTALYNLAAGGHCGLLARLGSGLHRRPHQTDGFHQAQSVQLGC